MKKASRQFGSHIDLVLIDTSDRTFEGWINADEVDRQGDLVDPLGFTAEEYMQIIGGTIQGTHSNIPVGRWRRIVLRERNDKLCWYGYGVIFSGDSKRGLESYPVWDDYWNYMVTRYKAGKPVGLSIGADPDYKEHVPYRKCDDERCYRYVPKAYWYETSIVMHEGGPALKSATVANINSLAKMNSELMKMHPDVLLEKRARPVSDDPNENGLVGRLAGDVGHIHPPSGMAREDPIDDDRRYPQQKTLPEVNPKRLGEVFPWRRKGKYSVGGGIRGTKHRFSGKRFQSPLKAPKYAMESIGELEHKAEIQTDGLRPEGLEKGAYQDESKLPQDFRQGGLVMSDTGFNKQNKVGEFSPTEQEMEEGNGLMVHGQRHYRTEAQPSEHQPLEKGNPFLDRPGNRSGSSRVEWAGRAAGAFGKDPKSARDVAAKRERPKVVGTVPPNYTAARFSKPGKGALWPGRFLKYGGGIPGGLSVADGGDGEGEHGMVGSMGGLRVSSSHDKELQKDYSKGKPGQTRPLSPLDAPTMPTADWGNNRTFIGGKELKGDPKVTPKSGISKDVPTKPGTKFHGEKISLPLPVTHQEDSGGTINVVRSPRGEGYRQHPNRITHAESGVNKMDDFTQYILEKAMKLRAEYGPEIAKASISFDLGYMGMSSGLAKGLGEELVNGETSSLIKIAELEKDHNEYSGYSTDPDEDLSKEKRKEFASHDFPSPMTGEPHFRPGSDPQPNAHGKVDETVGKEGKLEKECSCHMEKSKRPRMLHERNQPIERGPEPSLQKDEKDDENKKGKMSPVEGKARSGDGTSGEGNEKPQAGIPEGQNPDGEMPQAMDGNPARGMMDENISTHPGQMGPTTEEIPTNAPIGMNAMPGSNLATALLSGVSDAELASMIAVLMSLKKDQMTTNTPGAFQSRMVPKVPN